MRSYEDNHIKDGAFAVHNVMGVILILGTELGMDGAFFGAQLRL